MGAPPDRPSFPDPAEVLLEKARQDYHLAQLVAGDASVSSDLVGFHCQQAIEKCLKSVLSRHAIAYRRTHDLAELLDLLHDCGLEVSPALESAAILTPFAVEMRYDYLPPEFSDSGFDRAGAVRMAFAALEWATKAMN